MDANSKYQLTASERGEAIWGFNDWLEKNAGKDAAKAFSAILTAETFAISFRGYPEEKLTNIQKGALGHARRELTNVVAWLKAQGCHE